MGTLMDKLNATNASKEQIRQAIERKKVSVPENTPLKDYPAKIDGIYPDALFLEKITKKGGTLNVKGNAQHKLFVFGGNLVICETSYGTKYYYSKNDGTTWSSRSFPSYQEEGYSDVFSACVANDKFIVGLKKGIAYTTDLANWKHVKIIDSRDYVVKSIVFGRNKYVVSFTNATGDRFFKSYESSDMKSWKEIANSGAGAVKWFVNNKFFSTGYYSGLMYSEDLRTWKDVGSSSYSSGVKGLCYDEVNKRYFISSKPTNYNNGYLHTTRDLINLESYDMPEEIKLNNGFDDLLCVGGILLCSQQEGTKYVGVVYGNSQVFCYQLDASYDIAFKTTIAEHNGLFIGIKKIGEVSGNNHSCKTIYSADGLTWGDNFGTCVDVNNNNKTQEVLSFLNATPTQILQAAYEAGVNSI